MVKVKQYLDQYCNQVLLLSRDVLNISEASLVTATAVANSTSDVIAIEYIWLFVEV